MKHLENLHKKIVRLDELVEITSRLQSSGKKVVFTNGCFDILHKGHVTYLAKAADLGDFLVLGLNSDDSVRRQGKSPERPINSFDSRALIIAGLGFIDYVIEFDEDTPLKLIQSISPDVLVKGGDYDPNETNAEAKTYIVGSDIVRKKGGQVEIVNLVDGFSTTGIIKKLRG